MFGSRSYSLSSNSKPRTSFGSVGKITYKNDITDDVSPPAKPFNRQNRPGTLPAGYKRPTSQSSSAPSGLSASQSDNPNVMERFISRLSLPRTKRGRSLSEPPDCELFKDDEEFTKSWSRNEEEVGAIFTASLKKVRYRSNFDKPLADKEDNISYLSWETLKKRVFKAGTLARLVEHLTPTNPAVLEEDSGFLVCFLCTYKTFASTEEVLDLLLERYMVFKNDLEAKTVKIDAGNYVLRALSIWLEQYPGDFDEPPHYGLLHKIINFAKNNKDTKSQINLLKKTEDLLDNISVSPFVYEGPYTFKFCNCDIPVGCVCDREMYYMCKDDSVVIERDICITSFHSPVVAEQLTLVDSELFKRVVPRHCLACYWSKRDKLTGARAPVTIKATVDHFNAVVKTVTSTILDAVGSKTKLKDNQARAKVISAWISIAQECRNLKNFSSLKATLSGLQSTPIHRLKKTWPLLSRETQCLYEELSEIFSDDMNSKASRDLLMQEGTAKYATIDGRSSRKSLKKRRSWMKEGIMQGTVPYLGTFLTDLTMIDSAYPNKLENDYINFDKRRKEFEIIAQIKLLQESAKNYQIKPNPNFISWFHSMETYNISCELEPDDRAVTPIARRNQETLRKHASVPDLFSKLNLEGHDEVDCKGANRFLSLLSKTMSKNVSPEMSPVASPSPTSQLLSPDMNRLFGEKSEIAKVMLGDATEHIYKSILISVDDRTHNIIERSLEKYHIDAKPEGYSLFQVIPGTSLLLFHCGLARSDLKAGLWGVRHPL
eukprot:gene15613-17187_t